MPAPLTPPSEDILAYISIPSVDAALERSADVGRTLQPKNTEKVTSAQLRSQLGTMLGDPELKFMDGTKPIVIALLKGPASGPVPPVLAILPAKEGAPYAAQLAQMGMQAQTVEGVLAVAQSPDALASAAKAKALHDKIAAEKGTKLARVFLDAEGLLAVHGATVRGQIGQMVRMFEGLGAMTGQGQETMQATAKILHVEALGLLSLLEQADAVQVDLDWGKKGFDVDALLAARPGSELAGFFSASASTPAPDRSLVRGVGLMKASFAMDMATFDKLAARVVEDLRKEQGASDLLTPDVVSLFTSMKDFWKGTGAMSMDISGKNLSPEYDLRVPSEEKLLESMERMGKLMAPGSPIANLYKVLGLEPTWSQQKNVREHAKVRVHRVEMTFQPSPGAPSKGQAEAMKVLVDQKLELAVVGDRAVSSGVPSDLDRMIDRALAKEEGDPLPMTSMQVFGKGRQIYLDYDIFGIWRAMAKGMDPNDPTAAVILRLSRSASASPMTYAVTLGESRSLLQMRVPMDMVENVVKAGMETAEAEAGK